MKQRSTLILLGVVVMAIWGAIVFKINNLKVDEEVNLKTNDVNPNQELIASYFQGKSLKLNYIDPFDISDKNELLKRKGNTTISSRVILPPIQAPQTSSKITQEIKKPPVINWPKIIVKGVVFENRGSRKFSSILLNEKSLIVEENDKINEDFIVSKITSDSIFLQHKDKTKGYATN